VARGAAYADFDGDGDLDVLVTTNGGAPLLLRNDEDGSQGWLRVALVGKASARDAYGARLELEAPAGTLVRTVRAGSSYASQSEAAVTFGLGRRAAGESAGRLRIVWPSGRQQTIEGLTARRAYRITEGEDPAR
jgi:hypothetical protein